MDGNDFDLMVVVLIKTTASWWRPWLSWLQEGVRCQGRSRRRPGCSCTQQLGHGPRRDTAGARAAWGMGLTVLGSSSSAASLSLDVGVLDAVASGRSDAGRQQKGGDEARAQDGGAICSEKIDRGPQILCA